MVVSEVVFPPGFLAWTCSTWTCDGCRFPIREYGLNYSAQPLQEHEIKAMMKDETIMQRVLASYKLMLDFYGMRLEDEATGLISRSKDYAAQYRNLCSTYSCSDFILQSRPRSRQGWYVLPYAFTRVSVVPSLILSVRPHRTSDDEPIVGDSAAALQSLCRVIRSLTHRPCLFLQ